MGIKVGDTFKINVPMLVKWEIKDFWVDQVYRFHAVLTDGIIRVSYTLKDLEQFKENNAVIQGCWN